MKYRISFIKAVLAGICIGLGGTVFLKTKDLFPGANIIGALLFSIGLFAICTRGYNLFTGKACAILDNKPEYLIELAIIWIGNFIGTALLALCLRATSLCGTEGIDSAATLLVEAKMAQSYLSLFLLGAVCNIFIYIAVNGYQKNPHEPGKYLAIFLGVSCFILCGTEHSVADMYYWNLSGMIVKYPAESVLRLLTITFGNMAGAVIFPALEKMTIERTPK